MKLLVILLGSVAGIGSFVVASALATKYQAEIMTLAVSAGTLGPFAYVILTALAIIVAPLGFGFLIPVAAQAFGPLIAALYSILGWTIGSVVVWFLMRRYAKVYVQDTKVVTYITQLEKAASPTRWYITILLLRVALPVDVLSYALGLGSSISFRPYLVTTIVGVTPFAILSSYAAVGPLEEQLLVGVSAAILFLGGIVYVAKRVA